MGWAVLDQFTGFRHPGKRSGKHEEAFPVYGEEWLPWMGIVFGVLVSGFYFPFGVLFLPSDVALAAVMLWQGALTGFRGERGFVWLYGENEPTEGARSVRIALLVLALLFKYMLLRAWFPEEGGRLLFLGGICYYTAPVLLAGKLGDQQERWLGRRWRKAAVWQAWLVWVGAVCLVLWGRALKGMSYDGLLLVFVVIGMVAVVQWYVSAVIREKQEETSGEVIMSASFLSEITLYGTILVARQLLF